MNKYEEKRQRIMEILNRRQESISMIEHGLKDLSKDVKLLKKDFKDGMDSLAECFSTSNSNSENLKFIIDNKFKKK